MPLITVGVRETAPPFDANTNNNSLSSTADSSVVWIVASVVGGVFFLGAIFSLVLVMYTRRRQQLLRQQQPHPYLARHEIARRRKLSESEFTIEEERRRSNMIRKSLANRSSVSAGSGYSVRLGQVEQAEQELVVMERQESVRLKDDWKRWEARMRQERAVSPGQHPAARPLTGDVPILTIPSPAKHRSQGRTTTTGNRPNSPPAPPSYPG
ncbi:hypothetical protein C8A05DRAFT_47816 [Staphylotrichum tortipilum]|uniref:Uncharacterized protein n=1 Tax=Staphylotrichum tortipilum TaxID=2831512 RepID=A0AAN6MCN7_9PEZI|nr:hypothetical protein C8A05DRAFT_47816 [Staphylotrichum longicolle]